mgnify:CR=1 FL=1
MQKISKIHKKIKKKTTKNALKTSTPKMYKNVNFTGFLA